MKIKLGISKKISMFILIPLSVYIIVLVTITGVKFANQSEFDNGHMSRLLSERSAAHAEIVLQEHQSNVRTLANILSVDKTELDSAGREFFKETLLQLAKDQTYWLILPSAFYADSDYQGGEWVLLQASNGGFEHHRNIDIQTIREQRAMADEHQHSHLPKRRDMWLCMQTIQNPRLRFAGKKSGGILQRGGYKTPD